MKTTQLKKQIDGYISHFDDDQLEAILKVAQVLDKNIPDYELSDKEWAETEKNYNELITGKVKGIPAAEVTHKLKSDLNKRKK